MFHVPQTQRFCKGDFTWDNKITTLPGFHVMAAMYDRFFNFFHKSNPIPLAFKEPCSLYRLRFMNLGWLCINACLIYKIRRSLFPSTVDGLYWTVCLSILPVYHFFAFLFYTDLMSIGFLLGCQFAFLHHRTNIAAFLGLLSVLIRQTSVIWFAFLVFDDVIPFLTKKDSTKCEEPSSPSILNEIRNVIYKAWDIKKFLLRRYGTSLLVLSLFVAFVWVNEGIVVGDRSAHQPVFHGAQIPYLFLFLSGSFFPFYLHPDRLFHALYLSWASFESRICTLVSVGLLAVLFLYGRIAHLYLISDNRHFTFYIWKKFLSRDVIVILLLPLTWISARITWQTWFERKGRLVALAFLVCSALSLFPSALFEFR